MEISIGKEKKRFKDLSCFALKLIVFACDLQVKLKGCDKEPEPENI